MRKFDASSFVLGLAVMVIAAVFFFGETDNAFSFGWIGIIAIVGIGGAFLASAIQLLLKERSYNPEHVDSLDS